MIDVYWKLRISFYCSTTLERIVRTDLDMPHFHVLLEIVDNPSVVIVCPSSDKPVGEVVTALVQVWFHFRSTFCARTTSLMYSTVPQCDVMLCWGCKGRVLIWYWSLTPNVALSVWKECLYALTVNVLVKEEKLKSDRCLIIGLAREATVFLLNSALWLRWSQWL